MLKDYFIFWFYSLLSQAILIGYMFGQFFMDESLIFKYWYLFLFIGGLQTIIVMMAVKIGSLFISILTIQLILIMLAYSFTYIVNYFFLKNTKPSLTDFVSFLFMISGIYISRKFERINLEYYK